MRVIAGKARGTRLNSVEGLATRPVLDRVKESLYSMLDARGAIEEARVLDLYAGSGSLGIEALSRGAGGCVFVDASPDCIRVIRENLEKAGLAGRSKAVLDDCAAAAEGFAEAGRGFDLVLVDPPFAEAKAMADQPDEGLARALDSAARTLSAEGLLVLRVERGSTVPERIGPAGILVRRGRGRSEVCIYTRASAGADGDGEAPR